MSSAIKILNSNSSIKYHHIILHYLYCSKICKKKIYFWNGKRSWIVVKMLQLVARFFSRNAKKEGERWGNMVIKVICEKKEIAQKIINKAIIYRTWYASRLLNCLIKFFSMFWLCGNKGRFAQTSMLSSTLNWNVSFWT